MTNDKPNLNARTMRVPYDPRCKRIHDMKTLKPYTKSKFECPWSYVK